MKKYLPNIRSSTYSLPIIVAVVTIILFGGVGVASATVTYDGTKIIISGWTDTAANGTYGLRQQI